MNEKTKNKNKIKHKKETDPNAKKVRLSHKTISIRNHGVTYEDFKVTKITRMNKNSIHSRITTNQNIYKRY